MLLRVLINNIVPAFIVIGVGFTLDRTLKPHIPTISRLALYALSPALVFTLLVNSELESSQLTLIAGYAAAVHLAMIAVTALTAQALRLDQATAPAFTLAGTMVNSGNFGLSVILFAYGEEGLRLAVIYFVTTAVLANTVGAFIASRSSGSWTQSVRGVLRLPLIYATLLAVAFRLVGYVPPQVVMRPLETIGQAAVPVLLLMLGMQLSRSRVQEDLRLSSLAAVYKLVLMALVAFGLAEVMGLTGLVRQVCIVESSTPTAVTAVLLATEFRARPQVVASTVFLSTLGAAVTLTVVIATLA
ncbi:MAG: AEC family transporter [Anaerolineae bacterium]|nr:AEC family transporter [Anaerolineae bacterium]